MNTAEEDLLSLAANEIRLECPSIPSDEQVLAATRRVLYLLRDGLTAEMLKQGRRGYEIDPNNEIGETWRWMIDALLESA